jgi:IS4 transposase
VTIFQAFAGRESASCSIDFERLCRFTPESAFFVIRSKSNVLLQRHDSRPVDKTTGLRSDHTVILTSRAASSTYPDPLLRVTCCGPETGKRLKFLTRNFNLPALTVAQIYKSRREVELFFGWIKQHLRIKAFYGVSENAVKTQVCIAVCVLVAIVRKRLGLKASLYRESPRFTGTSEPRPPGGVKPLRQPVVRLLTRQP